MPPTAHNRSAMDVERAVIRPAHPRRVDVDPWGIIDDSKNRLDRLRDLVRRDDDSSRVFSSRRGQAVSLPRSDRLGRAGVGLALPILLACQAWSWHLAHAAFHLAMVLPAVLGLALCLGIAWRSSWAIRLRLESLPLTLLLMTAVGMGCVALASRLTGTTTFELVMLGLALGTTAVAAGGAGLALVLTAPATAIWGLRLLAVGGSLFLAASAFLG